MSVKETTKQLKLLQDELACLRDAEQHVEQKINALLDQLYKEINENEESPPDLHDLSSALRRFEAEHPALTDSINRILVTLSNMGI
jgi:septal ring factor EnvC (AmiA/AmiB activator)